LQVLAVLALFAPLVGYVLKHLLASGYHPNAGDIEARKQRGQKRAMKPKEHARLAPKPAAGELPPKLPMEDF
jgi:hypothetical protein